jgi:hypothetical protein
MEEVEVISALPPFRAGRPHLTGSFENSSVSSLRELPLVDTENWG